MKMSKNTKIIVSALTLAILIVVSIGLYNFVKANSLVYIYLVKGNSGQEQLVPVERKVLKGESHMKSAIVQLLKGPSQKEQEEGYATEIPKKTTLLSINEGKDKIILDLSKDFEADGGSMSMMVRLEQLAFTVKENAEKKPVYLELEGKKVEAIGGEGVEVTQPLTP